MKQFHRYGAIAAVWAAAGPALADSAQTLGGIVVKSDDGNFVGSLGGRVHFDYTGIMPDKQIPFDSGAAENDSGFYFRRVFISLSGKIYEWRYRIDEDISNTSNPAAGFQDVYISHDIGKYGTVRIGQTKPWRSLDELLSNNDKIFTERNINSATGIFGGRDYQEGVFYRYSHPAAFHRDDLLWAGASIYSLNKAGQTSTGPTGSPTQGIGYNFRLAYAPIDTTYEWVHVGASFSSDHADNGASLVSYSSNWYSYKGITQNVAKLAGSPAATPGSSSSTGGGPSLGGGDNPNVVTIASELAGAFGPLYLQSEFAHAQFRQPTPVKATIPNKQSVDAFSAEGSFYLTGETKRYEPTIASYTTPKPLHPYGALEFVAGFNFEKNHDIGDGTPCAPAVGKIATGSTITKCDLSYYTAGVNYYANSSVRFMLDYYYGVYDLGNAGSDRPKAVNARFQIVF